VIAPLSGPAPVLVVDHDDSTRGLVAFALRRAGLDILEAPSSQAALDVVRTTALSLVVLDMKMPGMSGIEVVQTLRSRSETATLPVLLMTGSGDEDSVIQGLAAGADDFLPKPVRLDELVARVNAHLRRQVAWSSVVEQRSAQVARQRAVIAETLRGLRPGDTPEATAQAICRHVMSLSGVTAAQIFIFELDGRANPISFTVAGQPDPPLRRLPLQRSQHLHDRAAQGPWIEPWAPKPGHPYDELLTGLGVHLVAYAPVRFNSELIGLLVTDAGESVTEAALAESLAGLVEFADLAGALVGRDVAERTKAHGAREKIHNVIDRRAFSPVFQPILDLEKGRVVGYEGLTRFADGVSPEVRFGEAAAVGLGLDLEKATLQAAVSAAKDLPRSAWLSLNVSPTLIVAHQPLQSLLHGTRRHVVIEVTEQVAIPDYEAFRASAADLGPKTELAVDDAGAGFASLRHILELRPAFVKLDRSLIAGIDRDPVRQALIVGMRHFARSAGCRLIAEGIETEAEKATLLELQIRLGQGYLFGPAAPAAAAMSRAGSGHQVPLRRTAATRNGVPVPAPRERMA
jgi:EAL domain-containing protein (putative c-di-GMP-specific phosphodiesterase class I)/CheY-like chemotaxis protein